MTWMEQARSCDGKAFKAVLTRVTKASQEQADVKQKVVCVQDIPVAVS